MSDIPKFQGPDAPEWSHKDLPVGEVRLHYVEAGQGDLVVLLHGFPEFWYSWKHQLRALAEAGFRAVAPDMRGYNRSERPKGVRNYRASKLIADVAGLIRGLGHERAFVVGHDWGGVLVWRFAEVYPDLVRKLAILNAPHPARFREELKRNPRQRLRSMYTLFFQLPWLPEMVLRARNFRRVERVLRQTAHPETFSEQDISAYKQALSGRGALTGPLNYYRAAFRYSSDLYGPPQDVRVPTLLIWGERDAYLGVRLTKGLGRWVPELKVERIADASHWVQNDAPERVNRLLIQFFSA